MVEVHGLRHCKNESCSVWMNRVGEPLWTVTDFISFQDYNAALNIRKNLLYYIENGCWNPLFQRSKKKRIAGELDDSVYIGIIDPPPTLLDQHQQLI